MSQRERVLRELHTTEVLLAIRWAYESAARRTKDDFDEATGHDAAWFGISRWKLFCDRLDRVFSCGKYATMNDLAQSVGLDILFATLTKEEQGSMPSLEPGTVFRDDVLGSPGWSNGEVRWLLASVKPGGVDKIKWARRSPLKQRVAQQADPDNEQLSIFGVLTEEPSLADPQAAVEHAQGLDRTTLVVTHAQDMDTDRRELYIGLPSMESDDKAWAWKADLLTVRPASTPSKRVPSTSEPDTAPDAPVRLRNPVKKAQPGVSYPPRPESGSRDATRVAEGR